MNSDLEPISLPNFNAAVLFYERESIWSRLWTSVITVSADTTATSVHFHFKVALFVKIKQNGRPLRVPEQTSDSASIEKSSKAFHNMEMDTYGSFYKDWEVDVFDPVRWPTQRRPSLEH